MSYDKVQKTLPAQIDLNSFLKKHCFFETSISTDQESKDIRSIINDVNIQNLVTMIRNLFFMSPNTHIGNYFQEEGKNFINLEKENLRVFTSEDNNISYFNYINNNKTDIDSFLEGNNLKQIPESELTYSRELSLNSSIDEVSGKQYITDSVKNYVNDVMIEKLKNVNHIKQSNYSNLGFFTPTSVVAAKETNKIFTGNFFDVNLSQYDVTKDIGIGELSSYILLSALGVNIDFPESVDNIANNLFIENYRNKSNEIIYRFNSSITKYENKANNRDNKGTISSSDRFNLDDSSIYYLNDLYLKNKVDSFVKSQKLNLIKNNDINLQFANDIVNNIKNSSIQKKLLSYCRNDKENISVLNSENQIFKLFFTEDEENENTFYSHIDIASNHKIDDSIFMSVFFSFQC